MRFYLNEQWEAVDRARLASVGRPAMTFNVIESLVRAMEGTQRAMRNDVRFAPVADANSETSQVQDALWLHVQNQNGLEFIESEVYKRGIITGRGFYDVRVDFDDQLQGQVKIAGLRSQDVVLDPGIDSMLTPTWPQVNVSRWTNLLDIEFMFGKDKAEKLKYSSTPTWYDYEDELLGSNMGRAPYFQNGWTTQSEDDRRLVRALRMIDRQYYLIKRKEVFVDTTTGETSEIPETWDRERIGHVLQSTPGLGTMKRNVKTVRWTVTCEDVVLHDEDSPYKWFTVVPHFHSFIDGRTMGAVETLLDPQELYNKVTSQELHIINTTANSGWISRKGNIKNHTPEGMETVGSRTGLFLEVEDVSQIKKIEPNQVPTGHDRISTKADSIMRSLSGVSNQARGFAREDVAGEAILMNQAAGDVNFASPLANLHRAKQILATRVLDCIQTYYTETRVIMINRGSTYKPEFNSITINQPTPEGEVVNDVTRGKFTTVLVPSPARSTLTDSEFDQLVRLRQDIGLQIPDAMLIEMSNIPNKGQLIQQMKGDSNEAQQAQAQMQQQIQQLELQLTQAKAEKEQSAAQLNQARANKATVESQNDPDAAYERVENNRIQTDAQIARERMGMEQETIGVKRRADDHNTALKLTQIDAENARHKQKLLVDQSKHAVEMAQAATDAKAKAAAAAPKPTTKKKGTRP